jgi:hypothetical protein
MSLEEKRSTTERRSRVVNTPASYSRDPGFKSLLRRPAILIEVVRGFPQSLHVNARDSTLKLGHDHFLPDPFQFIIIHLSPYHRRCTV